MQASFANYATVSLQNMPAGQKGRHLLAAIAPQLSTNIAKPGALPVVSNQPANIATVDMVTQVSSGTGILSQSTCTSKISPCWLLCQPTMDGHDCSRYASPPPYSILPTLFKLFKSLSLWPLSYMVGILATTIIPLP